MNRNKQTDFLGGVITLVVLILLIFLSNISVDKLSFAESFANTIVKPIQNVMHNLKNKASGNTSYFSDLETLKKENEELKAQNSELETSLRELEMVKADNAVLQENMNLTQKYSTYSAIPADVIDKDVSNYSSTLILNVGKNDGIERNMAVIADKGLVGHVISVTDTTAKVQVIVDAASTVSCIIGSRNESIICKGTIEDEKILRATYIPLEAELIQGDSIETSGIGGIYPKGIHIGTIKEIITTSNKTDRYAIIEPAVDFSKVYTVLVIKK